MCRWNFLNTSSFNEFPILTDARFAMLDISFSSSCRSHEKYFASSGAWLEKDIWEREGDEQLHTAKTKCLYQLRKMCLKKEKKDEKESAAPCWVKNKKKVGEKREHLNDAVVEFPSFVRLWRNNSLCHLLFERA